MDLTRNTPPTSGKQHVGFYDSQTHLVTLVLELRGWELSEKDAEGLRLLGLSWEEAKKRMSWAEWKQEY